MEVIGRLLYLVVLLLVGVGLRAGGLLDESRTNRLNLAVYYVALPALVFTSAYDQPLAELVSPALLAGVWVVLLSTAALAWVVHRNRDPSARRGVAVVQSYHSNLGYLGLPLVAATFGSEAAAVGSVVLGIGVLTQVPLTILVLVRLNGAAVSIRRQLRRLVTDPVLTALAAGLAVSTVGLPVPTLAVTGLEGLAGLALPLALCCVGASIRLELSEVDVGATGSVVACNVCLMPVLAWAVFSVLGVGGTAFAAAVVMFGTPTAVSTFIYATEHGGDEAFASLNVFVTTVASVATLFVLIALVG
ncbi:AEC family transporter [Halomontanus rarus]|uniref:AEC family transporter n=1 Tax=Halomontanus rarus TaxID=3034020 RepID=UPI0023E846D3|nr:AEC family transporter [Halovivax sp. TS33]